MLQRRCVARLTATLLAASQTTTFPRAGHAEQPQQAVAVAVVAGGFLIQASQYQSYANALEALGCTTVIYADESVMSRPKDLADGAQSLLARVESQASKVGLSRAAPLILLGHSRGCKTCVAAACRSQRQVAAMVLIDPVDRTGPDPSSVLSHLATLQVPTAVLGSGKSEFDCAPLESNYLRFAEALETACTPRLVGFLARAGHTQFVDNRRVMAVDVCTTGKDADAAIREVALEATAAWVGAALPPITSEAMGSTRKAAVARLQQSHFQASVTWEAADI